MNAPPSVCGLHTYSEMSGRNKLARHRKRGDTDVVMLFCDICDSWHVERAPESPKEATR